MVKGVTIWNHLGFKTPPEQSTKNLVVLGDIGDYTTQLCGDYFINHEIRIPIKQPVFHGKYPALFFSWLTSGKHVFCRQNPRAQRSACCLRVFKGCRWEARVRGFDLQECREMMEKVIRNCRHNYNRTI